MARVGDNLNIKRRSGLIWGVALSVLFTGLFIVGNPHEQNSAGIIKTNGRSDRLFGTVCV